MSNLKVLDKETNLLGCVNGECFYFGVNYTFKGDQGNNVFRK